MKDSRISLASYTIKTYYYGHGGLHLKQWKIEGSNDCSNWTQLDAKDTDAPNGSDFTKNFECSQITNQFFRHIRLTQTGPNWGNSHNLEVSEIELFGRFLSSNL